jgi:hypothetical protein
MMAGLSMMVGDSDKPRKNQVVVNCDATAELVGHFFLTN